MLPSFTPSAAVGSSRMTTWRAKAAGPLRTHWRWLPESVSTACVIERMPTFQVGHALDCDFEHLLLVEHAQCVAEEAFAAHLAAEEQILGDRHRRGHGPG